MTKTLIIAAVALMSSVASAAPVRTVQGERVDTNDYVTVSWSMDDPTSLQTLRAVSGMPGVLAVNTDGAGARSRVGPYLRSRGIDLPAVVGQSGADSAELAASEGSELVLAALEARGVAGSVHVAAR